MKKFKNDFGVKGSEVLLKAFKEEVEKLGWRYDYDFSKGYSVDHPDLYFNADSNDPEDNMKIGHFSFSNVYDGKIYILPKQWDECLKVAAEIEEEIPEYVEVTINYFGYKKGDICKVIEKEEDGDIIVYNPNRISYSRYTPNVCYVIKNTKPSTKEAYDKQQEEFKMKELLEEVNKRHKKFIEAMYKPEEEPIKIAGYTAKFKDGKVSIGCYKDITLKDLKAMKKAIKVASKFGKDFTITEDSVIDNTEDSAIFLDEIEQLIERLDE